MAEAPLRIDKPFDGKLHVSEEVYEQLKDPGNFSWEEKFYIFYSTLVQAIGAVHEAKFTKDKHRALEYRETATGALKVAFYLQHATGRSFPPLKAEYLFHPPENLDSVKRAWGDRVMEGIAENDLLSQIWAFEYERLHHLAGTHKVSHMTAEMKILGAPSAAKNLFDYKANADYGLSSLRLEQVNEVIAYLRENFWSKDLEAPNEVIDTLMDNFFEARKGDVEAVLRDRGYKYNELSKALLQQISKEDRERIEEEKKTTLEELVRNMLGFDCDEGPDCPVHSAKGMFGRAEAAPTSQHISQTEDDKPSTSIQATASTTDLTVSNSKESGNNTMALKNPLVKKDDELKFQNVSVQFVEDPKLKHIQLPVGMTLKEARHWLQVIEDEEKRTFIFEKKFSGWFPLDAMWATYRALAELRGFVHVADFKNWWGDTPPTMMTIEIAYGKTEQIPWGPLEIHGFSAPLTPSIELEKGLPTLVFRAQIRNNERFEAETLMKKAEQVLSTMSIYRGRAVAVDFTMFDPRDFRFDATKAPRFWDTSKTREDQLIFPDDVQAEMATSLWGPIRKTAQARAHGVPLRRGILIDGSYGVGKTLAASVTAKVCQDNGWTFLYLKELSQLESALYFAKKYEPCVIFAEDVNRITGGDRDADMDKLFNVMDGVDRKNDEVMVVFTTNNIEEIHAGMLRPGRIDSVIKVTPPDAIAAQKLVRLYGKDTLATDVDLTEIGNLLAGQIPAIIRESVERAKLSAILDTDDGQSVVVRESHLKTAAKQMLLHAEYLKPKPEETPDLVVLGQTLGNVFAAGVRAQYGIDPDYDKSIKQVNREGLKAVIDEAGRPPNGQLPTS